MQVCTNTDIGTVLVCTVRHWNIFKGKKVYMSSLVNVLETSTELACKPPNIRKKLCFDVFNENKTEVILGAYRI